MRNENVPSADEQQYAIQQNTYAQILEDGTTIEEFINKVQGNSRMITKDGIHIWVRDEKKLRICNAICSDYIESTIQSIFERHGKTANVTDEQISRICMITGRDLTRTFIHESKVFELRTIWILPLKNMILDFLELGLSKSKDAKMLNVIAETTKHQITQTNIQKEPEEQNKGLPLVGRLFK